MPCPRVASAALAILFFLAWSDSFVASYAEQSKRVDGNPAGRRRRGKLAKTAQPPSARIKRVFPPSGIGTSATQFEIDTEQRSYIWKNPSTYAATIKSRNTRRRYKTTGFPSPPLLPIPRENGGAAELPLRSKRSFEKTRREWSSPATGVASVPTVGSLSDRYSPPHSRSSETTTHSTTDTTNKLDMALFTTHFCNMVAWMMPVVLVPVVAAEHAPHSAAKFTAMVASISTLGAALGKFLNGFVCKRLGGRQSSIHYLMGLSLCSLLLSFSNKSYFCWALFGMDFFASIQWTSCSVILSNHYGDDPSRFGKGIAILSLASTMGTLTSKALGTCLLQYCSWRTVAQLGAAISFLGSWVVRSAVSERPSGSVALPQQAQGSVAESLRHILGSRIFWHLGLAHSLTFLGRTSERVLGTFFQEATGLPRAICGGLTASISIGLIVGLIRGRAFDALHDVKSKSRLLKRFYCYSVLSTLALAACATEWLASLVRFKKCFVAGAIALSSGAMASTIAYQIYQIPPLVAKMFGRNKAVCLSFLDGMGYLISAPVWALANQIISTHGWSATWTLLATLIAAGGVLMVQGISHVLASNINSGVGPNLAPRKRFHRRI